MNATHFLRFGTHAESKYFLNEGKAVYEGIIFNGNMVAYTQAAVAAFIINTHEKDFLIDPQTHAFQHDTSFLMSKNSKGELKVKQSIQKLADALGEPVVSKLSSGLPVSPDDFADVETANTFAKNVIGFQKNIIDTIKEQDDWKYLEFKLKDQNLGEPVPKGLIAPYFYMSEASYSRWLSTNVKLIDASAEHVGETELIAQLVITKDLIINEVARNEIIEAYGNTSASTIALWIDQLNTVEASKMELEGFQKLAEGLNKKGKKVVDLYGGYFSILLAKKGILQGVCNGLEYGESRAVIPVGGGIPMAKYYFYPLHYRMRFADLITVNRAMGWEGELEKFKTEACACLNCSDGDIQKYGITTPVRIKRKNGIVTLNYPTPETKERSLLHYLDCKKREFETVKSTDLDDLLKEMTEAVPVYEKILGIDTVAHLNRWVDVLRP